MLARHCQKLRMSSAAAPLIKAPPMVFIKGEEMTAYCMELVMEKWIRPHVDVSEWEYFDLSCRKHVLGINPSPRPTTHLI